ncbi:MAG TPA: pilin [Verrucomicrobiae bacterium]|nr:pilin [Verrucomicrobiae bacterium]
MSFLHYLLPIAQAADISIKPKGTPDPSGGANAISLIEKMTTNIVDFLFLIGGILAIIYLLWSGITYITAGGSAEKAKLARSGIINAVIGIIVMMGTFFIIRLATTFGNFASTADTPATPAKKP